MKFITRKCTESDCRLALYSKGMCKYHYDHNRYLEKITVKRIESEPIREAFVNGNWNTDQLSALEVAGNVSM